MAPTSYSDLLLENLRATRARKQLDQADVSERMRALGYTSWHRQTLGKVERGERKLAASELFGLALALGTSMSALLAGPADSAIELSDEIRIDGAEVTALAYGRNNGVVIWEGNKPRPGNAAREWWGGREDDPARDLV